MLRAPHGPASAYCSSSPFPVAATAPGPPCAGVPTVPRGTSSSTRSAPVPGAAASPLLVPAAPSLPLTPLVPRCPAVQAPQYLASTRAFLPCVCVPPLRSRHSWSVALRASAVTPLPRCTTATGLPCHSAPSHHVPSLPRAVVDRARWPDLLCPSAEAQSPWPLPCDLARVVSGPRAVLGHAAGVRRCASPSRSSRVAPPPPPGRWQPAGETGLMLLPAPLLVPSKKTLRGYESKPSFYTGTFLQNT